MPKEFCHRKENFRDNAAKRRDNMTVYELRKKLESIVNQNKKIVVWEDERSLESDSDQVIEVQDCRNGVYIVSI